jgi:predicted RNA-binding protein YlxR (DUF448 family)
MVKLKHVPERSCVACGTKRAKADLVRVVRTSQGEVAVDETGKANGRGAYLCGRSECWEQALIQQKIGRFERALRGKLTPTDKAMLQARAEAFAAK